MALETAEPSLVLPSLQTRPLEKSSESYAKLTRKGNLEKPSTASTTNLEADSSFAHQAFQYAQKAAGSIERKLIENDLVYPSDILMLHGFLKGFGGLDYPVQPETLQAIGNKKANPDLAIKAGQVAGILALSYGSFAAASSLGVEDAMARALTESPKMARYLAPAAKWGVASDLSGVFQEGVKQIKDGKLDMERFGKVILSNAATGAAGGAIMEGLPADTLSKALVRVTGASAYGYGTALMEGQSKLEATTNGAFMGLMAALSTKEVTQAQKEGVYQGALRRTEEAFKADAMEKGYTPAETEKLGQLGKAAFQDFVESKGGIDKIDVSKFEQNSKELFERMKKVVGPKPAEDVLAPKQIEAKAETPFDIHKDISPNVETSFKTVGDLFAKSGMRREFVPILDTKVRVVDDVGEGRADGQFIEGVDTILIKKGLSEKRFSQVLEHEMIHALESKVSGKTTEGGVDRALASGIFPETAVPALRSEIIPGTKEFIEQDVAPAIKAAGENIAQVGDDIQKTFAPATRGEAAQTMAGIVRENAAELARKKEVTFAALKSASKAFDKLPKETNYQFINEMEAGKPQSVKELQPVADNLRKLLDERREQIRAMGTGKLEHFIENYFPHIWKDPEQASGVFAKIFGKRPLEGSKSFLKQRTIPTFAEGIKLGLEPVSDNPIDLALLKVHEMDRYIMGQQIFNEMKDKGLAKFVKFGGAAPDNYVKINDKIARIYQYSDADKGFVMRGEYYAPEPVARILNNYLSPGLKGNALYDAVRASGNLMNQVQLGMSAFHLGFTSVDALVSRAALGIQQLSRGELKKGAVSVASGLDIVTQPIRNYLKGDKVLKEYFAPGTQGEEVAKITDALIAAGGRVKMDSFYKNSAVESFWKAFNAGNYPGAAVRSIPATIEALAKPIMEVVVPRQKLGVFFDMAQDALSRLPVDAPRDQIREVMGKAWDSVDNRLGQIVYDNLFWNKAIKDLGLASVRSLGWNLGTIRELGGGLVDIPTTAYKRFKGEPAELSTRSAYVIALPFIVGMMGGIMNYLFTGEAPKELQDYYFPRTGKMRPDGKPERISFPSYMKDVYAYYKDPVTTVGHKIHPIGSSIIDMLKNQDYYGTQIRNPEDPAVKQVGQLFEFIAKQFVPFSIRNYTQRKETGGTTAQSLESFVGLTPAPSSVYQSPAEEKALGFVRMRMPSIRTQADADKAKQAREVVDSLRGQEEVAGKIQKAIEEGKINPEQAQRVFIKSRQTALQNAVKMLPMNETLTVLEAATPEERDALRTIALQKFENTYKRMKPFEVQNTVEKLKGMGLIKK